MPERVRAYRGEEVVTIIKGRVGGRGSTTIRNSHGFTETVKSKELSPITGNDKLARLRYGDPE